MKEIKYLDIQEFIDLGFLFEVNRRVLHPFGLALEVRQDDDGKYQLYGIWDYRDDPEGMQFAPDTFVHGTAKWDKFMRQYGQACLDIRQKAVGYIEQVTPDEPEDG